MQRKSTKNIAKMPHDALSSEGETTKTCMKNVVELRKGAPKDVADALLEPHKFHGPLRQRIC